MKKLFVFLIVFLFSMNVSAELVVIGHSTNMDQLTKKDIKKLFLGKKTRFNNGNSVQVIELKEGSDIRTSFHDLATGRSEAQLQSTWSRLVFTGKAPAPIQVNDIDTMIKEVENNINAIGYIPEEKLTNSINTLFKLN